MNLRKIKLSAVSVFAAAAILLTACGGTENPAKDNGSDSQNEKPNPVSEFEYTIDSATDTVTVTRYNGSAAEVVFPSEIEGRPVTALGWSVLHENDTVTSVIIPDSVTTLNNEVFQGHDKLKTVKLSKNIKVIPRKAFMLCKSLESIEIPEGVTTIDYFAFHSCGNLKTVILPDSVTECDRNAFHGCESLPEVEYRGTVYKNSDGGGDWDMYDLVTAIRAQNQDKE
ncbi:MAG: leucine-rich repeat domain-containing protein [Butyrivibrio sp.]|nr:leucine-rich repeat domain-containing protein [Butyrivibrio sp.]